MKAPWRVEKSVTQQKEKDENQIIDACHQNQSEFFSTNISQDTLRAGASSLLSLANSDFPSFPTPALVHDYIPPRSSSNCVPTSQFSLEANFNNSAHDGEELTGTQQSQIGNCSKNNSNETAFGSMRNKLHQHMSNNTRDIWLPQKSNNPDYNDDHDHEYNLSQSKFSNTRNNLSKISSKILPMDRPSCWGSTKKSPKRMINLIDAKNKKSKSFGHQEKNENPQNGRMKSGFVKSGMLAQYPLSKISIENGKLDATSFRPSWMNALKPSPSHISRETDSIGNDEIINLDDIHDIKRDKKLLSNDGSCNNGYSNDQIDRNKDKNISNNSDSSWLASQTLSLVSTGLKDENEPIGIENSTDRSSKYRNQKIENDRTNLAHNDSSNGANSNSGKYSTISVDTTRQKDFRSPGSSSKATKHGKKVRAKAGTLKAIYQRLQRNIEEKECRMINVEKSLNDPQDPRNKALFYVDLTVLEDKELWPYRIVRSIVTNVYWKKMKCLRIEDSKEESILIMDINESFEGKNIEMIESQEGSSSVRQFLLPDYSDSLEGTLDCTYQNPSEIENGNLYVHNVDYTMNTALNNIHDAEAALLQMCDQNATHTTLLPGLSSSSSSSWPSSSLILNKSSMSYTEDGLQSTKNISTAESTADNNLLTQINLKGSSFNYVDGNNVAKIDYLNSKKDSNNVNKESVIENNNGMPVRDGATDVIKNETFTIGMHANAYFKADNFGRGKSKILARGTVIRLYDPELLLGSDMINSYNTEEMMEDAVSIDRETNKVAESNFTQNQPPFHVTAVSGDLISYPDEILLDNLQSNKINEHLSINRNSSSCHNNDSDDVIVTRSSSHDVEVEDIKMLRNNYQRTHKNIHRIICTQLYDILK